MDTKKIASWDADFTPYDDSSMKEFSQEFERSIRQSMLEAEAKVIERALTRYLGRIPTLGDYERVTRMFPPVQVQLPLFPGVTSKLPLRYYLDYAGTVIGSISTGTVFDTGGTGAEYKVEFNPEKQ